MSEGRPEKVLRFCPRCGNPYTYIDKKVKNGHTYYYAVHVYKVDGKRKVHKCYLGAKEYTYVKAMHPEMFENLTGMVDKDRYIRYLEDIAEVVSNMILSDEQKHRVKTALRQALNRLETPKPQAETQQGTLPSP
jgi:hypothetical protein